MYGFHCDRFLKICNFIGLTCFVVTLSITFASTRFVLVP